MNRPLTVGAGRTGAYLINSLPSPHSAPFVIVAIDGPAGSGKSTTARRVADALGWLYLDTGAMYRAVAVAFLDAGLPFTADAAERVLPGLQLDLRQDAGGALRVFLHGEDVTGRLRTPEVSEAASRVSAVPSVRARLVDVQRRIARERTAEGGGVVMEGRDIGTVVFPDAEVKVFMVANPMARAERRHRELADQGADASIEAVADELAARDARDSERAVAPLQQAEDAVTLDTTRLSIDEQVERVLALVRERSTRRGPSSARAAYHSRPTS